jgi:rubrerythrin
MKSDKRTTHKCLRCGYVWISKNEAPLSCPNKKCRSPFWNKERVVKT